MEDLDLRFGIGGGFGYRWFKTERTTLEFESSLNWISEHYENADDDEDYVVPSGTWATDFANHDLIHEVAAASLPAGAGAANSLNHNPVEAGSVRGPLLVIVKGETGGAQDIVLNAVMQAVT